MMNTVDVVLFTIGFSNDSQWCFSVVTWVSFVSKVEVRSTSNSSEGNRIQVQQTGSHLLVC
ncbi:unnamed protein product [Acanthoscelides obtectus]|uniref:Uncharacterized protein n=1 Tax=Acanthoscelides obtectus TaxID=200917 RepID=A0A9P0KUA2_ACAOB|nr:unnamed protein product [Acanthoscelides obtectus]CAK1674983.1 hypothetical protein AOBTE_LOCUS29843 [Acanthoscelides obtectus]